jgi:transcriptional regulator with XRE-family HTH domain
MVTYLEDDIRKRIVERRKALGMTQAELARASAKVRSRGNISDIECGKVPLTIGTLQGLAGALHVDILWLLMGEHVTVPATYLDFEQRLLALEEYVSRHQLEKETFMRITPAWKKNAEKVLTQVQRDALAPRGAVGVGQVFE